MDRKTASIVSAAAAVMAAGPALATPPAREPAVPVAASYAELLAPIPDAAARLDRADSEAPPRLIQAQYAAHHHHHHHHHSRRWYLQHGYVFQDGTWVLAPRPHHHHHHHHDHNDGR